LHLGVEHYDASKPFEGGPGKLYVTPARSGGREIGDACVMLGLKVREAGFDDVTQEGFARSAEEVDFQCINLTK
jgi:hypothetical protein